MIALARLVKIMITTHSASRGALSLIQRTRSGVVSFKVLVAALVVGGCAVIASLPSVSAQPPLPMPAGEVGNEEGVETLTQGPIHEAFANPAELDPTPGPVVMKRPPVDVQEEPPEFMPEDSIWIPGYWIWDDERDD